MNLKRLNRAGILLAVLGLSLEIPAQEAVFTNILRLTNRELALKFIAPSGINYRIDASTNLGASNALRWDSLLSLRSLGMNQHTDSAAPFASARFYRAEQLTNAIAFTGDHLSTTNGGDIVFRPLYHASLVMSWDGKIIYSDPDDEAVYEPRYAGLPQGQLILVTHEHGDHYSTAKLSSLRAAGGLIVVPQKIYNRSDFAGFRANAIPLHYGQTTNVMGIEVLAVPGYNGNHSYTNNNCYVLTMGGRRVFLSGDTGDVPEIRGLTNIDVAFLCMNLPFTMNSASATNVIRNMRPRIVYPYHYREGSGVTAVYTNAPFFKQLMGTDLAIEVRLRSWY